MDLKISIPSELSEQDGFDKHALNFSGVAVSRCLSRVAVSLVWPVWPRLALLTFGLLQKSSG